VTAAVFRELHVDALESKPVVAAGVAWACLAACLFLAFWVEWRVWAVGLAMLAAGMVWHLAAVRLRAAPA
jgi:hypothetical protein